MKNRLLGRMLTWLRSKSSLSDAADRCSKETNGLLSAEEFKEALPRSEKKEKLEPEWYPPVIRS